MPRSASSLSLHNTWSWLGGKGSTSCRLVSGHQRVGHSTQMLVAHFGRTALGSFTRCTSHMCYQWSVVVQGVLSTLGLNCGPFVDPDMWGPRDSLYGSQPGVELLLLFQQCLTTPRSLPAFVFTPALCFGVLIQVTCICLEDSVAFRYHWPLQTELKVNSMQYRCTARSASAKLGANQRDEPADLGSMVQVGKSLGSELVCSCTAYICSGTRPLCTGPLHLVVLMCKQIITHKHVGSTSLVCAQTLSPVSDFYVLQSTFKAQSRYEAEWIHKTQSMYDQRR